MVLMEGVPPFFHEVTLEVLIPSDLSNAVGLVPF